VLEWLAVAGRRGWDVFDVICSFEKSRDRVDVAVGLGEMRSSRFELSQQKINRCVCRWWCCASIFKGLI